MTFNTIFWPNFKTFSEPTNQKYINAKIKVNGSWGNPTWGFNALAYSFVILSFFLFLFFLIENLLLGPRKKYTYIHIHTCTYRHTHTQIAFRKITYLRK